MGKLSRFAVWLGSDWRLPFSVALVVMVTFAASVWVPAAIERATKARMRDVYAQRLADMRLRLERLDAERAAKAKQDAPQLVHVIGATPGS